MATNPELDRLNTDGAAWKRWGPYLSDRSWGTVREDDSADGNAWKCFPHDHARARAYRWGEDGIGGISDVDQRLCFALALWNGKDPILKERLFGLDNSEGNHGEDAKEYWFHLDSTPTHSSMKMLYKYPQTAFPYDQIVKTNSKRNRNDPEYELVDTGIFAENRYFDVEIEYAKASPEDILIVITATNRAKDAATLHLLPTLWLRNTWAFGVERQESAVQPSLSATTTADAAVAVLAQHDRMGEWTLACDRSPQGQPPALLFCENETNRQKLWNKPNRTAYTKDGIDEFVIKGKTTAVNPERRGTKAAAHYRLEIAGGASATIRLRLRKKTKEKDFADFDAVVKTRRAECDAFYTALQPTKIDADTRRVQRLAWAGMLWSKQWFAYNVPVWQRQVPEDGGKPPRAKRNAAWHHFDASDIISMPDKWEYPWFAAWDLAFHTIALAYVDIQFAKDQLLLMVEERYQHPNGAISAYEWNFDDVNPPVLARAAWRVYTIERDRTGTGDRLFLEVMFQKLSLNHGWWANRKDVSGNNLFQGGFLGLDNIGVFDRSAPLPTGGHLEQSDGTSWMAMFTLDLLMMALELSHDNEAYAEMAEKFMIHYLYLDVAMNNIGGQGHDLWDAQDGFYYDLLNHGDGNTTALKVRSMVGLIPLFATVPFMEGVAKHINLGGRLERLLRTRPRLAKACEDIMRKQTGTYRVATLVSREKLTAILQRMLDPKEFLSPYGIRALSKAHEEKPYEFFTGSHAHRVAYVPAESDSGMFGGNSNWRGPIWMPVNYLLVTSLKRYHLAFGDDMKVECPVGSGKYLTLAQVADDIALRLVGIFTKGKDGRRPVLGDNDLFQKDPNWRDQVPFYEYFHGDTGRGVGAMHQTGWTGLVAALIQEMGAADAVPMVSGGKAAPAKAVTVESKSAKPPVTATAPAKKAPAPIPAKSAKPTPAAKPSGKRKS
jgi:Glycosyl hydrolase family 63 C-terminal domain